MLLWNIPTPQHSYLLIEHIGILPMTERRILIDLVESS
nr:MAG TPA: hypothetical protein [Caudoviricetes sp.]